MAVFLTGGEGVFPGWPTSRLPPRALAGLSADCGGGRRHLREGVKLALERRLEAAEWSGELKWGRHRFASSPEPRLKCDPFRRAQWCDFSCRYMVSSPLS